MHALSPITATEPSSRGALAGFETRCSCGLVLRSSLRSALETDAAAHAGWHARQAARAETIKRDMVTIGPEAALRKAAERSSVERFERALRSVEGIYRRLDRGELTGRNSTATSRTLDSRLAELRGLVRDFDGVCDALDANDRLAARWNRIERRYVGAYVTA